MDEERNRVALFEFVREAHKGQLDKCGCDYFEAHLLPVARSVPPDLYYAALAHDILEDTETTVDQLREAGFTTVEIELIAILTKPPGKNDGGNAYAEYLDRIAINRDAKIIKIMDNASNLSRMHKIRDKGTSTRLTEKYLNALTRLMR